MGITKNITGAPALHAAPFDREDGPGKNSEAPADRELFIRNEFSRDPVMGCKLLFKRYYGVLCSHVVRFVYSRQIAEDIVSDVFCRFWEKQAYRHITCSYRAYLFAAARNAAINHLKKEFGRGTVDADDFAETLPAATDIRLSLQADELNKLIEKTVGALPPRCQEVFLMSRLEGKKNAEIARALQLSIKGVEAHITRALERLRKALKEQYP
jgi:RNA polymerase sigma-70 factor (family 1)